MGHCLATWATLSLVPWQLAAFSAQPEQMIPAADVAHALHSAADSDGEVGRAEDSRLEGGLTQKPEDSKDSSELPLLQHSRKLRVGPDGIIDWCQTQHRWEEKFGNRDSERGICPTEGTCDTPSVRNAWIPNGSTPIVTLCIKFNVFANSDGTSPAATQAGVDAQMAQLNADFLPARIQFSATTEFINNTTYRQFADSEESAMKSAYADNPGGQLNVYVVNIQAGYLGVGTFPWDPAALGTQGGLIIDDNWFGAGQKTLTHEVGHCVGLWHTHHGVSEVTTCSVCYERADGLEGDTTGDFAADTAPTPTNYNCSGPGGTDSCSGVAWGPTDPQNYMGYAPDSCYTEFSPQQWGRKHCWIDDVLTGWNCQAGPPTGGCCGSGSCSIETEADCAAASGTYLGDGTNCDGTPGDLNVYSSGTVNVVIPDGGGPGNPATHTINVPDSFTVAGVDIGLQTTHTWVGDLIATVQHGATTVTVIDRPGYTGSGYGCSADNYNIILDDSGTGGAIEGQCVTNLASPPNYTPNQLLSAFNGANASGAWTLRVSDNASSDTGTLNNWSVRIYEPGAGPCAAGCTTNPQCDDGLYCNGSETCVGGVCQAGTAPNCADSVSCTTDTCNEATDSCVHTPNNGACSDGLFCNGTETCHATLGCQVGTAPNCADTVACTTDSCNETTDACDHTPNHAACSDGLFCNGSETCSVTLGCQSGSDPCSGQPCDEVGDACIGGAEVWMSFTDPAAVPGLGTVQDEDIVARDVTTGAWSMVFDGSDVGLTALVIDGMAVLSTGDILLSFTVAATIPGMTGGPGGSTTLDDSDIVRFIPTSLGDTTAGSFVFYFDGSDVGLTLDGEDIDGIALTSDDRLILSTTGNVAVTGISAFDDDLLLFNHTSLGGVTAGTFAWYFDGTDVSLSDNTGEDIDAVSVASAGNLLLSTTGTVTVPGVTGANEDVLQFVPTLLGSTTAGSYSMYLDLSTLGISTGENIGAVEWVE